jgi:hypothetical protein
MATATGPPLEPGLGHKVLAWLAKVFELKPAALNWPRGVMFLDVALVPLIVFLAIGYEQYLFSALFGALFALLADPGGGIGYRASRIGGFALLGAGLTALAYGIAGDAWGWLVLAAFAVTLAASLAITFGVHRFVAGVLLNVWFVIALGIGSGFYQFNLTHHHAQITSHTWAQVAAWAGGSALWIAVTFIAWLIRGRQDQPPPLAEIPGDTSRRPLTRPLIMFAVIRALALAASVAIAFGANLSYGSWLPIATIIALKPDLTQATVVSVQRIAGALIGAAAAMLLLLIPANETGRQLLSIAHGLEVIALILIMHAVAIRLWNYALYSAAIAAAVLILLDLPQPTNYGAEGDRILWTLCGVAIGVLVMLLAGLLAKRSAKTPHQPALCARALPGGHRVCRPAAPRGGIGGALSHAGRPARPIACTRRRPTRSLAHARRPSRLPSDSRRSWLLPLRGPSPSCARAALPARASHRRR